MSWENQKKKVVLFSFEINPRFFRTLNRTMDTPIDLVWWGPEKVMDSRNYTIEQLGDIDIVVIDTRTSFGRATLRIFQKLRVEKILSPDVLILNANDSDKAFLYQSKLVSHSEPGLVAI